MIGVIARLSHSALSFFHRGMTLEFDPEALKRWAVS